MPYMLGELAPASFPEMVFAGAVSFPSGCSTLASKRMELLECVRLGAKAATVVLTPALVAGRHAAQMEKELGALATTAPELKLRVAVEVSALAEEDLIVLLRVLKSSRPDYLVTGTGVYGPATAPGLIRWLRDRLTSKVRLAAAGDPAQARALLEAGADLVVTEEPEIALEGGP